MCGAMRRGEGGISSYFIIRDYILVRFELLVCLPLHKWRQLALQPTSIRNRHSLSFTPLFHSCCWRAAAASPTIRLRLKLYPDVRLCDASASAKTSRLLVSLSLATIARMLLSE